MSLYNACSVRTVSPLLRKLRNWSYVTHITNMASRLQINTQNWAWHVLTVAVTCRREDITHPEVKYSREKIITSKKSKSIRKRAEWISYPGVSPARGLHSSTRHPFSVEHNVQRHTYISASLYFLRIHFADTKWIGNVYSNREIIKLNQFIYLLHLAVSERA